MILTMRLDKHVKNRVLNKQQLRKSMLHAAAGQSTSLWGLYFSPSLKIRTKMESFQRNDDIVVLYT
jgi:ABC-type microcin C transport system permease subunit YejB